MAKSFHIVPVSDVIVHSYDISCVCCPRMEVRGASECAQYDDQLLVVHNSGDRREELERQGKPTLLGWLTVEIGV